MIFQYHGPDSLFGDDKPAEIHLREMLEDLRIHQRHLLSTIQADAASFARRFIDIVNHATKLAEDENETTHWGSLGVMQGNSERIDAYIIDLLSTREMIKRIKQALGEEVRPKRVIKEEKESETKAPKKRATALKKGKKKQ